MLSGNILKYSHSMKQIEGCYTKNLIKTQHQAWEEEEEEKNTSNEPGDHLRGATNWSLLSLHQKLHYILKQITALFWLCLT